MNIERHTPCDALKAFVKAFVIIESDNGMQNTILPDTSIIMAFRYKGNILHCTNDTVSNRLPLSLVTGLRHTSRTIRYEQNAATLLAVLHEGAAPAFFNIPLHELFNLSVSLDELLPKDVLRVLEEQLAKAADTKKRIRLVEHFLLTLQRQRTADSLITHAVQQIRLNHGNIRIKELLSVLPISRDPFEKRFRRATGTSPKQFAALMRLRHLIDNHTAATSLTDLALAAGYYDQSHFIHDFTAFTGKAPKQFFNSGQYW